MDYIHIGQVVVGALIVWALKGVATAIFNAVVELKIIKTQIATLVEDTKSIPKIKDDINALHGKVRGLEIKQ